MFNISDGPYVYADIVSPFFHAKALSALRSEGGRQKI